MNLPRKQDLQRRKEYQQEIKEMQERVKGRPLLLEQVAQVTWSTYLVIFLFFNMETVFLCDQTSSSKDNKVILNTEDLIFLFFVALVAFIY